MTDKRLIRSDEKSITQEMMMTFVATTKNMLNLEKLHSALLSVQLTSVGAERMFSASSLFVTKRRMRMSDKMFGDNKETL